MKRVRTAPRLAPRPQDAHKASVGKVLVVGGSRDMCGAPALAAAGALRSGAGLVRVAVPRSIQGVVATMRPEATTAGLAEIRAGALSRAAAPAIARIAQAWDAVVLGPGVGRSASTLGLIREVATTIEKPLVLDADGLFAIGAAPETLAKRSHDTILTPHEGEAGRLLHVSSEEVRADRQAAAVKLAQTSGAVIVLKGPGTVVTDGTRLFVCRAGGPWLASGGTGDVLAGVAGAFLAGLPDTGGDAFGAACAAVHVHATAADMLANGETDRGLLASDVARALPYAASAWVKGAGSKRRSK